MQKKDSKKFCLDINKVKYIKEKFNTKYGKDRKQLAKAAGNFRSSKVEFNLSVVSRFLNLKEQSKDTILCFLKALYGEDVKFDEYATEYSEETTDQAIAEEVKQSEKLYVRNQTSTNSEESRVDIATKEQQERVEIPFFNLSANPPKAIGRDTELKQIEQYFMPDQQQDQVKVLVLHGMPGVGRTALALHYAHENKDRFKGGICHLDDGQDQVLASFLRFVRLHIGAIQIPNDLDSVGQVQYCWENWLHPEKSMLLIIDDIDDYSALKALLAGMPPNVRVLITAHKYLDTSIEHILIEPPSEDRSLEIFRSFLGEKYPRLTEDEKIHRQLCRQLGCLPFALRLIADALKRRKNISAQMHLQQLRKQGRGLSHDLDAVFTIVWNDLPVSVQPFAILIGVFDVSLIPWSLLEAVADRTPLIHNSFDCLQILMDYNLVTFESDDVVKRHQLVHQFFASRSLATADMNSFKSSAAQVMLENCRLLPEQPTGEDVDTFNFLYPHALHVLEDGAELLPENEQLAVAHTYHHLGLMLYYQQRLANAATCYDRAYTLFCQYEGRNTPNAAEVLRVWAALERSRKNWPVAEQKARAARDIYQNLGDREKILESRQTLAGVQVMQFRIQMLDNDAQVNKQDPDELDRELIEILKQKEMMFGLDHHELPVVLDLQTKLYEARGKEDKQFLDRAIELHDEAIRINRDAPDVGREHLHTATSYNNRAKCYELLKNFPASRSDYEEAIDIFETLNLSFQKGWCMRNLGFMLAEARKNKEALFYLEEAYNILQEVLGEDDPRVKECSEKVQELS